MNCSAFGFIRNLWGSAAEDVGPSDPDISVSETDPTESLERKALLELLVDTSLYEIEQVVSEVRETLSSLLGVLAKETNFFL